MDDVEYYDSQLQYQKRVGEIEKERLQLEREMFSMMRSDKKLQNLRAAKLRSYWQQVCERETRARERNEELLRDFEQLEIKLAAMDARTNKLRKMKMEYDEKVKEMYPKWRQEVELSRAKRQLAERGINFTSGQNMRPKSNQNSPRSKISPRNQAKTVSSIQDVSSPVKSRTKAPDASNTSLHSQATMQSPTKTVITSTPKSAASPSRSDHVSVQPPPDSFADSIPKESSPVATSSPIKSAQKTSDVVHTIPTAAHSDEGPSDFSDASGVSNDVHPKMVSASSSRPRSVQSPRSELYSPPTKSPKKDSRPSSRVDLFAATVSSSENAAEVSPSKQKSPHHSGSALMSPSKTSPVRVPTVPSPENTMSMKEIEKSMTPEPRPESKLSISSFGSDDISPRSNPTPRSNPSPRSSAPLTANAAYQALLKQHSGTNQMALEIPEIEEDSDDDLEDMLSPHGTGKLETPKSPKSESGESAVSSKKNAPVYIPTAMSTKNKAQPKQQSRAKVPWETDSEEEFDGNATNLSNTGGSSMWDQKLKKYDSDDDYDFYD